jgi:ABC-type branched-chain amino acid transport system, permease component
MSWPVPRSLVVTALVVALLPLVMPNNYVFDIAVRILLAAVAAIGLNLLMGFAGQISIGHAAFVAIGAYGSGIATARFGCPPLWAIVGSAAGAAAIGWLIAKPILRLQGHSLTMATLGLGLIVNIILVNEGAWTGGPDGMPVPALVVGGFAFAKLLHWYALAGAVLLVSIALSLNLYGSPAGRALRGLHGSEVAARTMGVDVARFKVRVFVVSTVFAAVSGSLTAHYLGYISPSLAAFTHSIELATMVVLGGMASTYGAVLGAGVLTILPQLFGGLSGYEMVFFGLVLMLTMIFLPKGLVPTIALKLQKRR